MAMAVAGASMVQLRKNTYYGTILWQNRKHFLQSIVPPRCFATVSSSCWDRPYFHSLLGGLADLAKPIPVRAQDVKILSTPAEYYQSIKESIIFSRERVVMASLYMGSGQLEQNLLEVLAGTVKKRPELQVNLLFDALRSTRPASRSDGTAFSNSAEMISKILLSCCNNYKAGDRVKVSLFQTPDLSKSLKWLLPPRLNEVVGVCHMKAYIFDDNVLMTGANLSTTYFTNRQDRYMWFHTNKALSDYLCQLIQTVSLYSYNLGVEGQLMPSKCCIDPLKAPVAFRSHISQDILALTSPVRPVHEIKPILNTCKQQNLLQVGGKFSDTWVFPTVQMGPFGISQDEACILWLLNHLPKHSHLCFASAYFNLTPDYEMALLEASLDNKVDILTASPKANGFYGSPGLSGFIPRAYSLLEQRLYYRARHCDNPNSMIKLKLKPNHTPGLDIMKKQKYNLHIFEYLRPGWTFHAKGLWCSLDEEPAPTVTLIGSSNYGYRSRQRDLEAQLMLITSDSYLVDCLQKEKDMLFSHTTEVHAAIFRERERLGGPISSLTAHAIRSWL